MFFRRLLPIFLITVAACAEVEFVDLAALPEISTKALGAIKVGMTRAGLERLCRLESGIQSPFYAERYVIPGYHIGRSLLMIDIRFKPADGSVSV